ncbi:Pentapeptide repeat [Dillenia turbinata]|uniref:Pentapeptide repeat n=1 Tax=Dillenia turbinata TaxID=194707 RepID=A0AAN8WD55_9MAGN
MALTITTSSTLSSSKTLTLTIALSPSTSRVSRSLHIPTKQPSSLSPIRRLQSQQTWKSNNWKTLIATALAAAVIGFSSCPLLLPISTNSKRTSRGAVHANENFRKLNWEIKNFTAVYTRESNLSGSTFNGAYLEKAVAYKDEYPFQMRPVQGMDPSQMVPIFSSGSAKFTNAVTQKIFGLVVHTTKGQGADLSDTLMVRMVLNEANLTNAVLVRTVLTHSDLGGAIIEGADFSDAVLDLPQKQHFHHGCERAKRATWSPEWENPTNIGKYEKHLLRPTYSRAHSSFAPGGMGVVNDQALCMYASGTNPITGVSTRKSLGRGNCRPNAYCSPSSPLLSFPRPSCSTEMASVMKPLAFVMQNTKIHTRSNFVPKRLVCNSGEVVQLHDQQDSSRGRTVRHENIP